jgi:glutathione S-transferase
MGAPRFLLHHAPRSRSLGSLWLLEEAGAPYELAWHDLEAGTHRRPDYLALNPAGKLPALVDRGPDGSWNGVVVTEAAAIAAYVADLLPASGLAPAIGTPERAAWQFWMAYGPGVVEPAMADLAFPRAAEAPRTAIGWPPLPEVLARIEAALDGRDWLLGTRFTTADVVVGGLLCFMNQLGKLRAGPQVSRYVAAIEARPARQRAYSTGASAP